MALVLNALDVATAVSMPAAMGAVEEAFRDLQSGSAQIPPRTIIVLPDGRGDCFFMPALLPRLGVWGTKVSPYVVDNPKRGLPSVFATILLMSVETGQTLAVLDAGGLTSLRTGATTGLAVRHLAREDAATLGIIGLGSVSFDQVAGVCAARPIRAVMAYSRSPQARTALLDRMSRDLGVDVRLADSPRSLCEASDVVVTATTSKEPVVSGEWLSPGTLVVTIGTMGPKAREVDTATVRRAAVLCDSREACLAEAGDLLIPIAEGAFKAEDVRASLGEVITGAKEGRERSDEIILFKSVGLAIEDLAVAHLAYSRATELGLGQPCSLG